MTGHINPQIDTEALPDIQKLDYKPIEKDFLRITLFYTSIFNLILVLLPVLYFLIRPFEMPLVLLYILLALILLRIVLSYIFAVKGFRHKAYAVRGRDVVYKSGWLWRTMVTIPFNRVQHLQVDQGPLERKMKLARLKIFTAGGQSSDLTIPGLRPETARRIKQFIVSKTSEDGEEEE